MEDRKILSICIPIYNRSYYLEKMLSRFLKERDLFENDIELIISDNCSQEDLSSICAKYENKGLALKYSRNKTNLGMDGNFSKCFELASGKYTFLLGSDDTPKAGALKFLVGVLKEGDWGLVHINNKNNIEYSVKRYNDIDYYLVTVNIWITFLSVNIVNTDIAKTINFHKYHGTFLTQVPAYLQCACFGYENAILTYNFLDPDNDSKNNGGYNFFVVFVENLFRILHEFQANGKISQKTYDKYKKECYKKYISYFIIKLIIQNRYSSTDKSKAKEILLKHYGNKIYSYSYLALNYLKIKIKCLKNRKVRIC